MAATARLEVRVRADSKARLEQAAALEHVGVSDFVRSAAEARADEVLREHDATTHLPGEFFDDLMTALEAVGSPNPALAEAATRARRLVTQR